MADDSITIMTILFEGHVAGSILCHGWFGDPEISFWMGKEYRRKGIAIQALSAFLDLLETRPLYARAAKDNVGSMRVLEKYGFTIAGEDKGFSNARGEEVEEFILKLDS